MTLLDREMYAEAEAARLPFVARGRRLVVKAQLDAAPHNDFWLVVEGWRRIEGLIEEAGPFVYRVTRTTMRPVPLV